MAGSSTLDPDNLPGGTGRGKRHVQKGHDTKSLGPSDTSDSGSDLAFPGTDRLVGDSGMNDNSDAGGTGERFTAGAEPDVRPGSDRDADRVVGEEEAGLGGGLDQAEEGRLGTTDEEIARRKRKSR